VCRSVISLALVTAVAAGCGGGGKPAGSSGMPTDSTSQRMTRSGYVGRADAICSGLRSRLSSLRQLSQATIGSLKAGRLTPSVFAEVAAWSGALLRATRGPYARIESLSIPPHDTLIRRWRSLVLRTGADTAALRTAALARDESGVTRALAADLVRVPFTCRWHDALASASAARRPSSHGPAGSMPDAGFSDLLT